MLPETPLPNRARHEGLRHEEQKCAGRAAAENAPKTHCSRVSVPAGMGLNSSLGLWSTQQFIAPRRHAAGCVLKVTGNLMKTMLLAVLPPLEFGSERLPGSC